MIDYHTHSIYSDGKSTYKEILKEVRKKPTNEITNTYQWINLMLSFGILYILYQFSSGIK